MRVFVYGSLMSGLHNSHFLDRATFHGSVLAEAGQFRMIDLGGFPGLVPDRLGPAIEGELYTVDEATAARLDRLEGVPRFYHHEAVRLRWAGKATQGGATAYVLTDPDRRAPVVESGDWRKYLTNRE